MLSASRRSFLEAAAIAALGATSVLVEHAQRGVEIRLFALAAILLAPALRRWLVTRGRSEPAAPMLLAFEIISFAGLLAYPVSLWGLALAAIPGIVLALPRRPTRESLEATGAEKTLVSVLALASSVAAWLALRGEHDAHLCLLGLAAMLLEAYGPGAPWKTADVSRRAASFALVLGWSLVEISQLEPVPWILPHPAKVACFLTGSFALLSGWTDFGVGEPVASKWGPLARKVFLASVAVNVLILIGHPFLPRLEEHVPLAQAQPVSGHQVMVVLSRRTALELTDDFELFEDGSPLPFREASLEAITREGHGRYRVTTVPAVHWSSRDGTDPLTNGRHYELVIHPSLPLVPAGRIAFFVAVVLGLLAWKLGAISIRGASPRAQRIALVALTVASFAVALGSGWDEILTSPDSDTYAKHAPTRPLLYPTFIDMFDRTPGSPEPIADSDSLRPHPDPDHRLIRVVRAQKIFTALSLAVLVFAFSEVLSVWWVVLLLYVGAFFELVPVRTSGVGYSIACVLSEGINHGLLFLYIAAIVAALSRPGWLRAMTVPGILTLLVLTRPSNSVLVVALGILWIHEQRAGWRRATVRTAVLALAFLMPILVACSFNAARTGRFRLSAMSGWAALAVTLEIANPDDVSTFHDDPELETFVRACLVDNPVKRVPDYTEESAARCINTNQGLIARPTFALVVKVPPGDVPEYYEDDLYMKVARRLIRLHPREYARLVLLNVSFARYYLTPLALTGFLLACFLYRRTREWIFLFCAFFTALPFVSQVPAFLVQCPLERYRSQLFFAETLAAPLLLAVIATVGRSAFEKKKLTPPTC